MLEELFVQTLNGIYYGSILFMIASGMTVILGILGILNLAHGELYAIGAYTTTSVLGYVVGISPPLSTPFGTAAFVFLVISGCFVASLLLLPIGAIIERVLMKPIYDRHELYQLLATFGLLFVLTDAIRFIWGERPVSVSGVYSPLSFSAIPVGEFQYPFYNVLVIVTAFALFGLLLYFFSYTKYGRIIRATAINREMATAIGINQNRVFTAIFALGAFLAGFGGAIFVPPTAANLDMGTTPLILSFVIIVIGGLGSIRGAFAAAMIVGLLSRWATWLYPQFEIAAPFAIMIAILLFKPEGLFGTWSELS
jgi:branched-chain amino acid transport system permease protein